MELNLKILITDDEPHIRKYLGIILKKFVAQPIIEANNGVEALALFDQHQPDLVFMDVNMPLMDGLETLKQLVSRHQGARVVMLTSVATRHVVHRSLDLGAIDFLRKDIPRDAIDAMLAEIIRRHFLEPGTASDASPAVGTSDPSPLQPDECFLMTTDRQPNAPA